MKGQKQTFFQLTGEFTGYLKRYRSQETLKRYQKAWEHVKDYMLQNKIKYYDDKVGEAFLKSRFGENYSYQVLGSTAEKTYAGYIEALADFQKLGTIVMGSGRRIQRVFKGQIGKSMTAFLEHRKNAFDLARPTATNYELYLYKFYLFLKAKGITSIKKINKDLIISFVRQVESKKLAARHMAFSIIRLYAKYLYAQDLLKVDYSRQLPNDNYKKQAQLPSTYSEEEINHFLRSVDRGSPKGKRNYAIFLLAIKLGIRTSDIRHLKFENISWEASTINFVQQKTGKPLTLPLPAEVGNAIIDYLKFGRPESDEPYCFLGIVAPYKMMGHNDIKNLVEFYLKRAQISINNRSHGPHALRHSFATHLLNSKTPLPVISEALGHTSTSSTMLYLRVDLSSLRQCALEVPAISSGLYKIKGGHHG
jgi:site-specific recombinase XerD